MADAYACAQKTVMKMPIVVRPFACAERTVDLKPNLSETLTKNHRYLSETKRDCYHK